MPAVGLFGPHRPCAWSGWFLETQVPDRLSFDQNSAQIRFRLSSGSDHLQPSLSPALDQVQNQSSSGSAQISFRLSSNQVQPSSGSDSGPSRFSSDQVHTQLKSCSAQPRLGFRSGPDHGRQNGLKCGPDPNPAAAGLALVYISGTGRLAVTDTAVRLVTLEEKPTTDF